MKISTILSTITFATYVSAACKSISLATDNEWCIANCSHDPPYCPQDVCHKDCLALSKATNTQGSPEPSSTTSADAEVDLDYNHDGLGYKIKDTFDDLKEKKDKFIDKVKSFFNSIFGKAAFLSFARESLSFPTRNATFFKVKQYLFGKYQQLIHPCQPKTWFEIPAIPNIDYYLNNHTDILSISTNNNRKSNNRLDYIQSWGISSIYNETGKNDVQNYNLIFRLQNLQYFINFRCFSHECSPIPIILKPDNPVPKKWRLSFEGSYLEEFRQDLVDQVFSGFLSVITTQNILPLITKSEIHSIDSQGSLQFVGNLKMIITPPLSKLRF